MYKSKKESLVSSVFERKMQTVLSIIGTIRNHPSFNLHQKKSNSKNPFSSSEKGFFSSIVKLFAKPLDKCTEMYYNIQDVREGKHNSIGRMAREVVSAALENLIENWNAASKKSHNQATFGVQLYCTKVEF